MTDDETSSINVARLLEDAAARASQMRIDEVARALDDAGAICLTMVSSKEHELEIRRRVAEWKMKLHCDRDVPFDTVERLRGDVASLGYTNLETEAGMEIYFALYCERQGRADHARHAIRHLRAKLDDALKTKTLDVYRHLKDVCDDILSRTDAR